MHDFKKIDATTIEFSIDLDIYSDGVISKVLYWLSSIFIIERKKVSPKCQHILLKHKTGDVTEDDLLRFEAEISQMFADYKVREIVRKETEGIRNILYLKAFANCSDLEDYRSEG